MLKNKIKQLISSLGYELVPTGSKNTDLTYKLTMEGGLHRCVQRGLEINTVIDVGAAIGDWTNISLNFLPQAEYLLIEAQVAHRESLEIVKKKHEKVDYIIAAAGNREGKIYFDNSALFGGLASEEAFEGNCIEVPVTTIDLQVTQKKLSPPYLIKLDTHGFEVPILEGAKETLKQANLVIIEAYNYQLTKDSLRYFELCQYMATLGFSPIEIVDCSLRAYDKSFWQMDIFFIPSSRKEFDFNQYA